MDRQTERLISRKVEIQRDRETAKQTGIPTDR